MRYLLDTHACLWAVMNPKKLSNIVTNILLSEESQIFVSQASIYEIAIKTKIGKLIELEISLPAFLDYLSFINYFILPIKNEHFIEYTNYPFNPEHKDPFDRLILATASFEQLPVISKDEKFDFYKDAIDIIW